MREYSNESGRSLIEVIGVMAIGGVLTVGVITTYNIIRNRQLRQFAASNIEQIAKDVKLLLELRGDYTGVSVDYLVKAGALKNTNPPMGDDDWSVTAGMDGKSFSINLTGLSRGECEYFATAKFDWATRVKVNDTDECMSGENEISFIVE